MKATIPATRLEKIEQLEALRNKMIQAANALGLQHPMVLNYSRKIDETHNKIMEMQQKDN
ncbi:aspartyl-phosphate phosphatase Spo0E family protein [Fictibacillus nanhaiensis]|uniref:aspartyl-phosphate phosphatase Spo0E family protein n=1 Tax=Fictibacillus nanhaiensis TaxID=742169 RepID=UPI003C13A2E8